MVRKEPKALVRSKLLKGQTEPPINTETNLKPHRNVMSQPLGIVIPENQLSLTSHTHNFE